jgi:hypothetical protein
MEKMTHAEYIAGLREEAGQIASIVLSGSMSLLDGCWLLGPLLAQAELKPGDPDAKAIGLVRSELDGLPVGPQRPLWSAASLKRLAPQLESLSHWASPLAMSAVKNVAQRFGA